MKIAVSTRGVGVDGTAVAEFSALEADPTDDDVPVVGAALATHAGRPGWIELPGGTSFFVARKLINAARRAGLDPLVLSETGGLRAYGLRKSPSYAIGGSCLDGPLAVTGTQPLVTVWIQTGRDGTWLLGEARHLPVVSGEPTDFLSADCTQPPDCASVYDAPKRRSLCSDERGPQEVRLGGETSACLVPLVKQPRDAQTWPEGLAAHIRRLGLAEQPLTKVVPEARSPVSTLVATLEGFRLAEAPIPAVGTTLLVEGNDGPLDCLRPEAVVRTADDLADSGARYLGSLSPQP
ncbi:MAG: hypothetical protein AAF211_28895 [Myxococcota bacterium]